MGTIQSGLRYRLGKNYSVRELLLSQSRASVWWTFEYSEPLARWWSTAVVATNTYIGKYERDEVKPSIDVVKNLADTLDTTVAFLLGETEDMELLKDPDMLKRLNDINNLPSKDKEGILFALDGLLRDAKTRLAYL
ncbi:MAG: helix-turn-helix transcriptional regulator [Saprospiraceae bacterium]|nr:helix-turn-helix transcriptional regulator [Saprospiraceae bacterium]